MATDKLKDDWEGPTAEELIETLARAVRRLEGAAPDPLGDETPHTDLSPEGTADFLTSSLRRCGLVASPPPIDGPHPLASAGLKLKDLRGRSGWTVEEIAERIGMPVDLLEAFENGDSGAAGELTSFDLEKLASACCGTLADLLGAEHSWVKAAQRRDARGGFPSLSFNPLG